MNNTSQNLAIVLQKPKPTYRNIGLTYDSVDSLRKTESLVLAKCNYKPTHSEMIELLVDVFTPYLKALPENYNIMTDITNRNLSLQ